MSCDETIVKNNTINMQNNNYKKLMWLAQKCVFRFNGEFYEQLRRNSNAVTDSSSLGWRLPDWLQ